VTEAVELFDALYRMAYRAWWESPNRSYMGMENDRLMRAEANDIAVLVLIEAVGATEGHPVAEDIRAKLGSTFNQRMDRDATREYLRGQASRLHGWIASEDFHTAVARWADLAVLPEEYARELMS
jgi:hypothetical protein